MCGCWNISKGEEDMSFRIICAESRIEGHIGQDNV